MTREEAAGELGVTRQYLAKEEGTMSKVSAQARRELVQAIRERYARARNDEKRRILDEFVAVTEYDRKNALRILNAPQAVSHDPMGQHYRKHVFLSKPR
jgi:hypothetical protein